MGWKNIVQDRQIGAGKEDSPWRRANLREKATGHLQK
jgi:hypothetical protein